MFLNSQKDISLYQECFLKYQISYINMHVNKYLTYDKNETILTVLKNLGNKAVSCVGVQANQMSTVISTECFCISPR